MNNLYVNVNCQLHTAEVQLLSQHIYKYKIMQLQHTPVKGNEFRLKVKEHN